jgi:hypothetical protein
LDIETFFLGLLMALSARGFREFSTWGEHYHRRFLAVARTAVVDAPVKVEDIEWMQGADRAFGTSDYAEKLVFFGMSARALTLDSPDMVRARLRPTSPEERARVGHIEWFDRLAEVFVAEPRRERK